MNQTEKRYIIKRIDEIVSSKRAELNKKYRTDRVYLDNDGVTKALIEGRFTLKEARKGYTSNYLRDFFDFDEETKSSFDQESYQKEYDKVLKKSQELKDEVMLGPDSAEVLKKLKQLEKM